MPAGNRDLAAACLVRLDSIGTEPRKLVQFSKSEVAEVMAGDGFLKAQEAFALADLAFAQSELAEREIQGHAATAGQKIKVGMMRTELETKFGKTLDADGQAIDADGNREGENLESRLDRLYPGGPLPEGYTFVEVDGSEANAD